MKLKNIIIDHYKNLGKNFSFEQSEKYIALIGLNGSGKSNLLETVCLLFAHILKIDTTDFPFSKYIIKYHIREHEVEISESSSDFKEQDLPSSVIACYSGEDNRLWNSGFKSYYIHFFNKAIKGGEYKPIFLYINKYCWKIAFISLLYSENEDVEHFIKEKLHIDPSSIKVKFKTKERSAPKKHDASNWYNRVESKFREKEIPIEELKNDEDIDLRCEKYPNLTNDQIVFYYLYFLCMPDKNGTYGLEADKLIDSISITVNDYNFDDLSEGEKKLILIECITKVLGDENSLVLFDEPDAHTHIAMTNDLLNLISKFDGQIIFTTHSPLFVKMIHDDNQNNIFYIENGKIVESRNNLIKKLSNDTMAVLDGTIYSRSNSYLLVEGKSDVNCLKAAIGKFPEFHKLQEISIISFNSASEAKVFFEQAFKDSMASVKKIVFLFDYDPAGLTEWKNLKEIVNTYPEQCKRLFYQKDYTEELSPDNIQPSDSILLEDLVKPSAYQQELDKIHAISSFHQLHAGGKISEKPIKDHIERECNSFKQEELSDFKPLLEKLYSIFNYN